ncbi:MAG: ecdysteroid 22-kinase family protein [Acidimicrobiia bacterium]|nr:ecdysteroid 22-kinase family protein [Acidimicrobiia bacterium]
MVEPISSIDECDADWLSAALGIDITIDRLEPIGEGVGLLGEVHRVRLGSIDGPRSVIVKLGSATNAAVALHFGYFEREWGAYRDLLEQATIATPRCLYNQLVNDRPCLVLEDLAEHRAGDQVRGITEPQAQAAVDLAAELHATFWNRAELRDLTWMPGPDDPRINGYGELFEMMWPDFLAGPGRDTPPARRDAAEAAMTHFDEVCRSFADEPITAVHGDFRLDNLLFSPTGEAAAIDWQLTARGRGPYDLAFLLAGSAETEFRRRHERPLLERYHARLAAAGVVDYPLSACWDDYRRAHIMNLPNPITAAVAVDAGNARGREMLRLNAQRALAAVADLWPNR